MRIVTAIGRSIREHPAPWAGVALLLGGLVAFALYWFAPWNLFVDRRVDEAIPTAGAVASADDEMTDDSGAPAGGTADDAMTDDGMAGDDSTMPGPIPLASGEFAGLEHPTTGTAVVLELEDGSRFLRLEGLETSNGPDLRVYLSSVPAQDNWYVYDDGEFVDLGALKGNIGSSNYVIPDGLDLSRFESAVVWCRRFSVGFGVAPLEPA